MAETKQQPTSAFYKSQTPPDWCPGCGDYGVLSSLQTACAALDLDPKDLVVVSGIGCSSNLPGFIKAYGFHSLHGRSVPVASGIKFGNHDLTVVITGGDGDGYGIGLGHFVHAMRRNLNVTYIVLNNEIYGLTTGQASPTTMKGSKTKSTPYGCIENQLNPEALALVSGATFVARGFSGEPQHLAETVKKAIQHKGFSLVDVMSPCVTYNKLNTYAWFRERVYKLEAEGHDPSNYEAAFKKSLEWDLRIPIGVFFRQDRPTYEDEEKALEFGPLAKQKLGLRDEDWQALIKEAL